MSDQNPPVPPEQPQHPQGGQPYPQGGGQPYYPQQGQPGYAMAPPKKSHLLRNIVIGVIVFFILMCGGCFAVIGIGANEASDDANDDVSVSDVESSGDDAPVDSGDAGAEDAAEEPEKEKAKQGTEENPAPRGKAVQNQSAKYQIDNVEVVDSLGDFTDPPAGKYVKVTITVENVKDETIQVSSSDFTLQVGGNQIDASDQSIFLDNAIVYEDLSPGLKKSGVIVFDVAPADAGKGVMKAQAMLSLDDAVYLKLTK